MGESHKFSLALAPALALLFASSRPVKVADLPVDISAIVAAEDQDVDEEDAEEGEEGAEGDDDDDGVHQVIFGPFVLCVSNKCIILFSISVLFPGDSTDSLASLPCLQDEFTTQKKAKKAPAASTAAAKEEKRVRLADIDQEGGEEGEEDDEEDDEEEALAERAGEIKLSLARMLWMNGLAKCVE